jgi:hypothetical protein
MGQKNGGTQKIYLVEKEWKVRYNKTCVSHESDDELYSIDRRMLATEE